MLPRPAAPRQEPRPVEPSDPLERSWLESGFYVMTLPVRIAVDIMLAPVTWFFSARPRQ